MEYQGLSVRGIIKAWENELLEEIKLFEAQAKTISDWDNQLREGEKNLGEVTEEVHRLIHHQNHVKTICDTIEVRTSRFSLSTICSYVM